MKELGIDIETFSEISLKSYGMYRYVNDPSFEILLLAYAFDNEEPVVVDLKAGEKIPEEVVEALLDPTVKKTAWNVPFEFTCLNKFFENLDITQWECTMVKATMVGYPLDLDKAGKALGLDVAKDKRGKELIKFFTVPCKPTKSNGFRTRNLPEHDPARWAAFKSYNIFDVKVERAIAGRVNFLRISPRERKFWLIDQKVNRRGVRLDLELVRNAIEINSKMNERLLARAMEITGLKNPNSVSQLKEWLSAQGAPFQKLDKESITTFLEEESMGDEVDELLRIRQQMAKSSIKKYKPMMLCADPSDCRARGLFQYYGANKTGRWASRIIQLHNLVRNKMKDLDLARRFVLQGDIDGLELLFGNVADVMSQLCRTAFVPTPGRLLGVTDFSAIEARGLAWFANEKWKLDVFAGDGKIYEAAGAHMFKCKPSDVVGELRSKAKIGELALGYQGSVGALERMGALKMGLKEEELLPLVKLWRASNPNIVKLWYGVENAAIMAIENPGKIVEAYWCKFIVKHKILFIQLPSGRFLTYIDVHFKPGNYDKPVIGFWGVDQVKKTWSRQETYGGKLVENIVQGASRDLLAEKMVLLDENGFDIVMHVHDELVLEIDRESDMERADKLMSQPVDWAPGLPLNAESFTTKYYIKS